MVGPGALHALPNLLLKELNWLDVEVVAINAMTFTRCLLVLIVLAQSVPNWSYYPW